MISYRLKSSSVMLVATAVALLFFASVSLAAAGQPAFGQIIVFGDSLSDPGNAFTLTHAQSTPPYDTLDALLIPDAPYAKGGHHFSNGATWIEQLARSIGLASSAGPAFQSAGAKASNYAVGGARAYEDGKNVNLSEQVKTFLTDAGGRAPSDGLYVIEIGGNDVRDAMAAYLYGGDPNAILGASLASIGYNIGALHAAGANKFLVWNAPDLGLTPAILALDSATGSQGAVVQLARFLEKMFNDNLDNMLGALSGLPGIEIKRFDVYGKMNELVADPAAFGMSVVNTACVTPNVAPFDCRTPEDYLFWDGIHPTKAAHAILAQDAALVLLH